MFLHMFSPTIPLCLMRVSLCVYTNFFRWVIAEKVSRIHKHARTIPKVACVTNSRKFLTDYNRPVETMMWCRF